MLKFTDTFLCRLKSKNIDERFTSTPTMLLIASQK